MGLFAQVPSRIGSTWGRVPTAKAPRPAPVAPPPRRPGLRGASGPFRPPGPSLPSVVRSGQVIGQLQTSAREPETEPARPPGPDSNLRHRALGGAIPTVRSTPAAARRITERAISDGLLAVNLAWARPGPPQTSLPSRID